MSEQKRAVTWFYNLNKGELLEKLEERGLRIDGAFSILRERLLKYERAGLDSIMDSHADKRAEAGIYTTEDRGDRSRPEPRDTSSDNKEPPARAEWSYQARQPR